MPEDEAVGLPVPPRGPVLYGRYASPFVRRVAVTLQLYGVVYRHQPLMPFGPDKAELAKFNPIARVPALRLEDGEMLIDSSVILDHLDQLVGPPRTLIPAAGAARRRVLTLLAVALGAVLFDFGVRDESAGALVSGQSAGQFQLAIGTHHRVRIDGKIDR